jgi:hypothetical protein
VRERRMISLTIPIFLCLVGVGALFILVDASAASPGLPRHVATDGQDDSDCTDTAFPCRTVQYAIDVADDDDVIKVAAGVYTGVNGYGGLAQVIYLTKTLTVRGGYTITDWTTSDPVANPTTLDAEGQGRVLYITGLISPTIEGVRMTGGDATGWGGGGGLDVGGGVFVSEAATTISNCVVYSNTASSSGEGRGGGLYLDHSAATLNDSTIAGNTASTADFGRGGGLYLYESDDATLSDNLVEGNTASKAWDGSGGGLFLLYSGATLDGNTILGNVGSTAYTGSGGGLRLSRSAATLTGNLVLSNMASTVDRGYGGGLGVSVSPATLTGNIVRGNRASLTDQGYGGGLDIAGSAATLNDNTIGRNIASTGPSAGGSGGGLSVRQGSDVIMNRNTLEGNSAGTIERGLGGGLFVKDSDITLTGNWLITNTATLDPTQLGSGGGLYVGTGTVLTLTNNVIAGNQANDLGNGLFFSGTAAEPTFGRLLYTTVANNLGSGQGVGVAGSVTLALTNTIIAGHHDEGIWVGTGCSATLEATLWYDNGKDTDGPGHIVIGSTNIHDDPAFVNPSLSDYHLTAASAAIDQGIGAGVDVDIDGQARPGGLGFDIGADEHWTLLVYLPLVARNMP